MVQNYDTKLGYKIRVHNEGTNQGTKLGYKIRVQNYGTKLCYKIMLQNYGTVRAQDRLTFIPVLTGTFLTGQYWRIYCPIITQIYY